MLRRPRPPRGRTPPGKARARGRTVIWPPRWYSAHGEVQTLEALAPDLTGSGAHLMGSTGPLDTRSWRDRILSGLAGGLGPIDREAPARAIADGGLDPGDRRPEPADGEATTGEKTARTGRSRRVGLHGSDGSLEQPACHPDPDENPGGSWRKGAGAPATDVRERHFGPTLRPVMTHPSARRCRLLIRCWPVIEDNPATFSKFDSDPKSATPFSVPADAPVVFLRSVQRPRSSLRRYSNRNVVGSGNPRCSRRRGRGPCRSRAG